MQDSAKAFFSRYFSLLSNNRPAYPWQSHLFDDLVNGNWPDSLALPTGAGKTSVLKVWLLALGWSLLNGQPKAIPRRLVWVVNRRVVVDQTTEEALAIEQWLRDNSKDDLTRALREASFTKTHAIAISTLRGQKADNGDWSKDPLRPAIIVGTVDMIGSRLLFRGYRDGRNNRPRHAGLLGVDSLIVNDESHLTPAFARLLRSIEALHPSKAIQRPFHTLLVSATEAGLGEKPFEHNIEIDLAESSEFRRAYDAEKRLSLIEAANAAEATKAILKIVRDTAATRTIIFIEQPEQAAKLAGQIETFAKDHVALLTGTMRGYEREKDQQDSNSAFSVFTQRNRPDERYFLVTTSAGEVGINMTCETMLTLLVESDRLFQRFGRLNRFGEYPGTAIILNPVKNSEKRSDSDKPREETLKYLRGLPAFEDGSLSVSCRTLRNNPAPVESRSKEPAIARFEERLVQLWSQTSAPSPGMKGTAAGSYIPQVDSWLHGRQDDQFPQTSVAWRAEVPYLANPNIGDQDRSKALKSYPVLPHETLTEPTRRLKEKLEALPEQESPVLLQDANGDIEVLTISEFCAKEDVELRDCLVLLSPGVGLLTKGMLSDDGTPANDVADFQNDRLRFWIERDSESWVKTPMEGGESVQSPPPSKLTPGRNARLFKLEIPGESGEEQSKWLIFETTRSNEWSTHEIALQDHLDNVAASAEEIATMALGHSGELYRKAGSIHDTGKADALWQRAMGGNIDAPLAKTRRAASPRLLNGYRHELKSYLDADESQDLLLHLVASHHGWARPYWEARACPPNYPWAEYRVQVLEAAYRFAKLQKEWGPWGLAYLEALLKSADILADEVDGNG